MVEARVFRYHKVYFFFSVSTHGSEKIIKKILGGEEAWGKSLITGWLGWLFFSVGEMEGVATPNFLGGGRGKPLEC